MGKVVSVSVCDLSRSDAQGGPERRVHTEFSEATEFSDQNRPSVLLCEPGEISDSLPACVLSR